MLGIYLLVGAVWPSACQPINPFEIYSCAAQLPMSGRWQEAALLAWLWISPLMLALVVLRRLHEWQGPYAGPPARRRTQ